MNDPTPHYTLTTATSRTEELGDWRFVLRPVGSSETIEVSDVEPGTRGERLDLLTVVRALEWLDQPSRVTLVGCTHYVEQGIQFGLPEWRENGWRWEWFGQMVPVRDADLWQRMDRILQFHRVECGQRRVDQRHETVADPHLDGVSAIGQWADRLVGGDWVKYAMPAMAGWCAALMDTVVRYWQSGVRAVAGCCSLFLLHRS